MFGHFVERMLMKGGGSSGSGGGGGRGNVGGPGGGSDPGNTSSSSSGAGGGFGSGAFGGGSFGVDNSNAAGGFSGLGSGGFGTSNAGYGGGGGGGNDGGGSLSIGGGSSISNDSNFSVDNSNASSGLSGLGPGGFAGSSSGTNDAITGSSSARNSFQKNVRELTVSRSQIANVRNPELQTNSFRRDRQAEMVNLDPNEESDIASMSTIDAEQPARDRFSFSPNFRNPNPESISVFNDKSLEGRVRATEAAQDAATMGLGGQLATNAASFFAGPIGGMFARGIRDSMVANELSNELQQISAETDYSLNANVDDLRNALGTEAISDMSFGFLGDTENYGIEAAVMAPDMTANELSSTPVDITAEDAAKAAEVSRMDFPEGPDRVGGGADSPSIPPAPIGPPASSVSAQPAQQGRGFGVGQLGDYSSYARRVFSRI